MHDQEKKVYPETGYKTGLTENSYVCSDLMRNKTGKVSSGEIETRQEFGLLIHRQ